MRQSAPGGVADTKHYNDCFIAGNTGVREVAMKKLFALILALGLCLSLSAPALAADYLVTGISDIPRKLDDNGYVSDEEASTDSDDEDRINYGDTIYFAFESDYHPDGLVTESTAVSSITTRTDWDSGRSIVESINTVRKKDAATGEYRYYLAVTLRESTSKSDTDVYGTITLKKTGTNGFDTPDNTLDLGVYITVGKPELEAYSGMTLTEYEAIYTFYSDMGDVLIYLTDGAVGYFEVEGANQELALSCDIEYDEDMVEKYPDAYLDFVNCNGARFSRTGRMVLYAEQGSYLYTVNDDGSLTRVFAGYDKQEGGLYFNTRTLDRYVISDIALPVSASSSSSSAASPSSSSSSVWVPTGGTVSEGAPTGGTTAGYVKTNPSTGAAA